MHHAAGPALTDHFDGHRFVNLDGVRR